jgi:hypothetical protein
MNPLNQALNREFELKFRAPDVTSRQFVRWAANFAFMSGYKHVVSNDVYYRQGQNTLRFRENEKKVGSELTVKLRTSKKSTMNRIEIDLPLSKRVDDDTAKAFLEATGWKPELELEKSSYIVRLHNYSTPWDDAPPVAVLALYAVKPIKPVRAALEDWFLEVEIEKESIESTKSGFKTAERYLGWWESVLKTEFNLGKPLNKSLYEIYTGNKYRTIKVK